MKTEVYMRMSMKNMLAYSLYALMKEKHFDKITIKEISAKTGVIRGTFYNHFHDKFEALEYLTYSILIDEDEIIEDYNQLLKNLLTKMDSEKTYFKHCFQIEGQNGFETIFRKLFYQLIDKFIMENHIDFSKINMNKELFVEMNVNTILFIIQYWITKQPEKNANEIFELFEFILTKSTKDLIEELRKTQ